MWQFRVLPILLGALIVHGSAFGQFSGGSGTTTDPWVLATAADIANLATTSTYWGDAFVQSAAIDMSAENPIQPIGIFDEPFTGTYDGGGFTIEDLIVLGRLQSQPGGDGFFGVVQASGAGFTIKELTLVSPTVIGASPDTGGLVGRMDGGIVQDCQVRGGCISGAENVGGLIGHVLDRGMILRCCSATCALGAENVGGLIGLNTGVVEDCYCQRNMVVQWGTQSSGSANVDLGGLIGRNFTGWVASCYADCDEVLSQVDPLVTINAGGLVGTWVPDQGPFLFGPANYSCQDTLGLPATFNNAIGSPASADLKAWSNMVAVSIPQALLHLKSTFRSWDFEYVWTIVSGKSPELR